VAEWFTDTVCFAEDDRRFMESISGCWIGEVPELKGVSQTDVRTLKNILSRVVDSARLAYGRTKTKMPRQCILIGTTNESVYLRDETGNRRFWPVKVGTVDIEKLKTDRDQLWAEAVHRFNAGESWTMREELWATAAAEQANRAAGDPLQEALEDRLGEFTDARIPTSDIWTLLGMGQGLGKQADAARIGQAMKRLGWEKAKMRFPERMGTVWGYRIGNGADILKVLKSASGEPSVIRDLPITP
jgi:predicted P-loop ATPase